MRRTPGARCATCGRPTRTISTPGGSSPAGPCRRGCDSIPPRWTRSTIWLKQNWADSYAYLNAHPGIATPDGRTCLDELLLAHPGHPALLQRGALLDRILADGIEAAYPPLLDEEAIDGWLATPDWPSSADYFDRHRDRLTGDGCYAVLNARPSSREVLAHRALLALARAGAADGGFGYVTDTDPGSRERRRWAALDLPAGALSDLGGVVFNEPLSPAEMVEGPLMMAVAAARQGNHDQAIRLAGSAVPMLTDHRRAEWAQRITSRLWPGCGS